MAKLFIFDMDGTLFDSKEEAWRLLTTTAKAVPELRFIDSRKTMMSVYRGNFYEEVCRRNKLPVSRAGALEKKLRKAGMGDYRPHLHPGMRAALKRMHHYKPLAILSSNFNSVIRRLLRQERVSNLFDAVSGADNHPSKARRVKALLKRFKLEPKDVLCVTDTTGDIKECRKAGVRSIGVAWGFHTPTMLRKAGAIAIVRKPQDLVRYANGD